MGGGAGGVALIERQALQNGSAFLVVALGAAGAAQLPKAEAQDEAEDDEDLDQDEEVIHCGRSTGPKPRVIRIWCS